jgi:DNA repair exonuclease SbcCD ATPase subunit
MTEDDLERLRETARRIRLRLKEMEANRSRADDVKKRRARRHRQIPGALQQELDRLMERLGWGD